VIAEDAGAAYPDAELRVGRLPVLTGDPVGFRQLFTNLLDNAIRHGGRVDLVVVVEGQECPDGGVELSVRDNGRGIPAEHRERVFGVFERLEGPSTSAGTGMGWPSAARSSRSSAAASASRATPGPTSGSCSRPRWRPAGPPRS